MKALGISIKGLILFILLTLTSNSIYSVKAPFNRGVNLTGWFQVDGPQQIQFTKYTRTDFEQIKSLGCDVIRLPINLHYMTNGTPDYTLDPLFLSFLDEVVAWCEELNIHLILDNHTFDVTKDTDPNVGTILENVWTQMATHYINASTLIYFEVLNEPHGIDDTKWNSIQQKVVDAIRKVDTIHTIVVGPASWNSYNNLNKMPVYNDNNLLYTFHFYDPFLFTHQGAGWTDLTPATGIPFPYSKENMPTCPSELKGTWVESSYNSYKNDGTEAKVKALIDIAVEFSNIRNVPVYCGEFGVYDLNSSVEDRAYWYRVVRNYLEEKDISWTIWDYHGGFGLFEKNSEGFFDHDLNVPLLEALGLNVPEQTPYLQKTDSIGFIIYNDFIGSKIYDASYNPGSLSFYSNNHPNSGDYCISWTGGAQYQGIVFDFKPDKDLSYLEENNYFLTMTMRTDIPNPQFDIRFLDSKTSDPEDHPWRIRKTITKNALPGDRQWHKLQIPLSSFTEQGSWDNNTWINPSGKFDWKLIDRLEIVQEYGGMGDKFLWIDNITITNIDTIQIGEIIGKNELKESGYFNGTEVLNQNKQLQITCPNSSGYITYRLIDIGGKQWFKGRFEDKITLSSNRLPSGLYLLYLQNSKAEVKINKIILKN